MLATGKKKVAQNWSMAKVSCAPRWWLCHCCSLHLVFLGMAARFTHAFGYRRTQWWAHCPQSHWGQVNEPCLLVQFRGL